MQQFKIQFDPEAYAMFLGRNGAFEQYGLYIGHDLDNTITFQPIRKNGKLARCGIDLPTDNIPAVIAALQSILDANKPPHPAPEPVEKEVNGPKPLQLRVGANYRAKNGYVFYIARKDLREFNQPFYADGVSFEYSFQEDGKAFPFGTGKIDLIEEVPMPVWKTGAEYYNRNRDICTIAHISSTNEGKVLLLHGFDHNGKPQTWNGQGLFANWQHSILDLVEEVQPIS